MKFVSSYEHQDFQLLWAICEKIYFDYLISHPT